jgi:hypothetical protein
MERSSHSAISWYYLVKQPGSEADHSLHPVPRLMAGVTLPLPMCNHGMHMGQLYHYHSRILLGEPQKIKKIRTGSLWDNNHTQNVPKERYNCRSPQHVVGEGNECTLSQVTWPVMHSDCFSNLTSQLTNARCTHFVSRKELWNTKY